jgi:hypothetical protein
MIERFNFDFSLKDGILPVLGEHTHIAAQMMYQEVCRAAKRESKPEPVFEEVKNLIYVLVEHQARIGYFAAQLGLSGDFYDAGCGKAIPSIVYSKLTGKKAVAVDKDPDEIVDANSLCSLVGASDVELVEGFAQRTIQEKGLTPDDLVIFSAPDMSLSYYVGRFMQDYDTNIVFSGLFPFRLTGKRIEEGIRDQMEDNYPGRNPLVIQSEKNPNLFMFYFNVSC